MGVFWYTYHWGGYIDISRDFFANIVIGKRSFFLSTCRERQIRVKLSEYAIAHSGRLMAAGDGPSRLQTARGQSGIVLLSCEGIPVALQLRNNKCIQHIMVIFSPTPIQRKGEAKYFFMDDRTHLRHTFFEHGGDTSPQLVCLANYERKRNVSSFSYVAYLMRKSYRFSGVGVTHQYTHILP